MTEAARLDVTRLDMREWERASARAVMPLPFGAAPWVRWGQTAAADRGFAPVLVCEDGVAGFLVPLCVSGSNAQIGAFGYGMVCPLRLRRDRPVPGFGELAQALCATLGLTRLTTLLPPPSAVEQVDRLVGHWAGTAGQPTYLLDLTEGADQAWIRARGVARTQVRRAVRQGVGACEPRAGDAAAVAELYAQTLRRNRSAAAELDHDLAFLTAGRADVVTRVARAGDMVQAVSAFAVARRTAFHVLQATSEAGRQSSAGYLAFWSAITALAAADVRRADLGSAVGAGQERFKLSWGSVPLATRVLDWAGGGQ